MSLKYSFIAVLTFAFSVIFFSCKKKCTRKSLGEYGDKLEAEEKEAIEKAIADLEETLKEGDKEAIDAKDIAKAEQVSR